MQPYFDYVVIEEIKKNDSVSTFKAEGDETALAVGKIVAISKADEYFEESDVGELVLFKRYAFDEHKGQLIGKGENIIAYFPKE